MPNSPRTASFTVAVIQLLFGLSVAVLIGRPAPASHAQTEFAVEIRNQPAPEVSFGEKIVFRLTATSSVPLADATLAIRMASANARTYWGKAPLLGQSTELDLVYELDLQQWSAESFSTLEYWWVFTDGQNRTISTTPLTLPYLDNRVQWRSLTDGRVTVNWQAGDEAFGRAALEAASDGLLRANQLLQGTLPESVAVYVYPDIASARATFAPTDPTWLDGKAFPEWNTAVVNVPDDVNALTRLSAEIPHEVMHLLIYRAVGGEQGYNNLPQWLNEGLAVLIEAGPGTEQAELLTEARKTGTLPSLERLCFNFSADQSQALIAYAQSASVVRYIQRTYGTARLNTLLQAYADGVDCSNGVRRAINLSLSELELEWDKATFTQSANRVTLTDPNAWAWLAGIVGVSSFVVSLILFFSSRRRPAGRMI